MLKKFMVFIAAAAVFSSLLVQPISAEKLLYEKVSTQIVSKGVVHENIKQFTSEGWLNINVLRIDLNNPYIKLDTIFSKEGINYRSNLLNMTKDSKSIASINGDFFSPYPNTNLAHPIGPVVKSGQMISSAADIQNKSTYSVFSLNSKNIPSYANWFKNIKLTAPDGKSMLIRDINKFGWYTFLYMYDSNWGPKTVGASEKFPTLTEMVVVNDKVTSFSIGKGAVDIPKNGYVLSGDYEAGKFLTENFKIGDEVKIGNKSIPNWNNISMAVGGGAILIKDGVIPSFKHDISGRHPRTALGTTKDNKKAILVTVDGRQALSKGMTQEELAQLMINLGAYNAINFDGGGSTTMVTRDLHNDLNIVNSYSDPNPRPVINGVGVFTSAPKSSLSGLKIETADTNIFVNSSRAFNVLGYDKYNNPVEIDPKSIKWSFSKVTGKFIDNIFYPTSTGSGKITAQINGVTASINIKVLSIPVELQISPSSIPVSLNAQWLNITGVDKDGYRAFIHSNDVSFAPNNILSITDNYARNKNSKSGVVKILFKGVTNYLTVGNIADSIVLDSFEKNNDSFWAYPAAVAGSYSLSENSKTGKYSGKLDFDFSVVDGVKGAYIKLNGNDGYNIDSKPTSVKVWVYSENIYSHSIRAEISDSNNKIYRPTFSSQIDWNGWKELSVSLPDDLSYPVKIKKLYVVEQNSEIKNKGELLFDDLKLVNTSSDYKIPQIKKVKDYKEKSVSLNGSQNSFRIALNGDSLYDENSFYFLNSDLSENSNIIAFTNTLQKDSIRNVKLPYFGEKSGFSSFNYKNSLFIKLSANSTKSIRKTDESQWIKLFDTLSSNTKDNVFILIDTPILGSDGFSDIYEAELLRDTLSEYKEKSKKNVWVAYTSSKSGTLNYNGVKYIGITNNTASSTSSVNYVLITVNDKNITYQIKSANK